MNDSEYKPAYALNTRRFLHAASERTVTEKT